MRESVHHMKSSSYDSIAKVVRSEVPLFVKGTKVVPPQNVLHFHQLDVIFEKLTTCNENPTSKQIAENRFFDF